MKKTVYKYSMVISIALLTIACVPSKKIVYFQDVEGVNVDETVVNYEPEIQIGDMLNINVSALDSEAATPFNLIENAGAMSAGSIKYLVNIDGELNFPVLGKIKVKDLTTKQLNALLTDRLSVYIQNPVVNIRLVNFKISVLGEVKSPGTFPIPNERVSVLEAISLAGDLTIQGKRSKVLLVREENGKRVFVNIDLTNKALFNSPYYYLAQNDVLYVTPNKAKINASGGFNIGTILGIVSTLISLTLLLTR